MNIFPIVHHYENDFSTAQRHLFALVGGGWSAKLVRPSGDGWQVVISGYRPGRSGRHGTP